MISHKFLNETGNGDIVTSILEMEDISKVRKLQKEVSTLISHSDSLGMSYQQWQVGFSLGMVAITRIMELEKRS